MVDEKQMDQGAPIPPQAQEKVEQGVTHAGGNKPGAIVDSFGTIRMFG